MAKPNPNSLQDLCRQALSSITHLTEISEDLVIQIVQENLGRGRFERFSNGHSGCRSLSDYVSQVVYYVCREHARIKALEQGNTIAWHQVRNFLIHRAARMLQGFQKSNPDIYSEALDLADETCLIIFNQPYPFDVAFEAWITVILKNLILMNHTRSTDAMDHYALRYSLDAPRVSSEGTVNTLSDFLTDGQSVTFFENVENQMVLLDAIDQLRSPAQRRVIRYSYLEEMDDAQIAKRIGKTKQAVYNLRKRALTRLRYILTRGTAQENKSKKH